MHLWLIDSRMRFLPDARLKKRMMTHILDYFWEDLELGLVDTLATSNPMVITKYSKMYLNIWYGSALAYDVGAIRSDTSMAEAVWRNLYESDASVPLSEIYKMVEYIRIQQHRLMEMSDEQILNAEWSWTKAPFEVPESEKAKLLGPAGRQATLFNTQITASPKLSELLRKQQETIKQEIQETKKQEQQNKQQ
uniref:Ubiquinol-cytochrome c chaperone domain-containing protein n=1 Tax=Arcella intermedia TaxID=1963864 RepID=A0A6B2LJK9_9EUKA